MKRLLQSYKFYAALFGTVAAFLGAKTFELDTSVNLVVVGLWATLIGGQAIKDFAVERNKNGK